MKGSGGKEELEHARRSTPPRAAVLPGALPTSPDTGWGSCTREKSCLFPTHPVSHLRHTAQSEAMEKHCPRTEAHT